MAQIFSSPTSNEYWPSKLALDLSFSWGWQSHDKNQVAHVSIFYFVNFHNFENYHTLIYFDKICATLILLLQRIIKIEWIFLTLFSTCQNVIVPSM